MFENEIQEEILSRMLQKIDNSLDKREGSIVYDMLAPAAAEFEQAYMELDNVLNFGFADTTYGEYLERRVREVGLVRKSAVQAYGQLTFAGQVNSIVPAGTIVSNGEDEPITAVTLKEAKITSEVVTVPAIVEVGGAEGNVAKGIFNTVVGDLASLFTVTNETPFEQGYDEETDEELIKRYQIRTQNLLATGNDTYYRLLATEVPGVFDARIYPRWNGNGSIKVVVLSPNKKAPSQTVIDAVTENINKQVLLGADITVEGVEEVTIDIDVKLTLQPGYEIPQEEMAENLQEYISSLAFNDLVVRYSRIGDAILDIEPVVDYENLYINGKTSNIVVEDYQVPVLGRLTITI